MAAKKRTRTIEGRELALVEGRRYIASRPMANRGMKLFPIFIRDIVGGNDIEILEGFTYDEANDFLATFNNGATSFDGRIW